MSDVSAPLRDLIDHLPLYSTHEHHREDSFHRDLTLDALFAASYVGWGPLPSSTSHQERADWLARVRWNSYFVWLEKALAALYGIEHITPENWDELSARVHHAHQDPRHHIRILQNTAHYQRFLQDAYWNPGSDAGHPEIATPVYRIDMWLAGHHPDATDHDGTSVRREVGDVFSSLDAYEEAMRTEIERRRPTTAALKCAAAYARSIDFRPATRSEAHAAFGRHPSELEPALRKAFGDYILSIALEVAARLGLPCQFHTGLAKLAGSSPLLLEPTIAAHPEVRFVLFHGGYPWIRETGALAHNYPNVALDLCWLPLISTSAAEAALHEYTEILPDLSLLAWGGDCWTSEESLGASLAFRHVLLRVLAQKVETGYLRAADAESIARALTSGNARRMYR